MSANNRTKKPIVFISYSWDNEEHKHWVKSLSDKLIENEIITLLDQNDLVLGDPLTQFMEQSIANSDYVLIICTPTYKRKADKRTGGVGYEESIITADVYSCQNHRKYIPVLAKGNWKTSVPIWASGKLGVDLTKDQFAGAEFDKLITTITGKIKRTESKRYIQKSPPELLTTKTLDDTDEIRILNIIKEDITLPRNDGTEGSALYAIPFQLSGYPSRRWIDLFIQAWNYPRCFSTMHRPGIARVSGNRIILDGTTIDEYKQFHQKTLQGAVAEANKKERELIEAQRKEEERKIRQEQQFRNDIDTKLDDIAF